MSRDVRLYLEDMLLCSQKVLRYTRSLAREQLIGDEKTYDAVLRNLEILGEAAKHIPADVRARHPGIDWRKITGLRDILAHAYSNIDDEILWDIVQNKVPALLTEMESMLGHEGL